MAYPGSVAVRPTRRGPRGGAVLILRRRRLTCVADAMPRKPKPPQHSQAHGAAEQADFKTWLADAVAQLQRAHNINPSIIPIRVWRHLTSTADHRATLRTRLPCLPATRGRPSSGFASHGNEKGPAKATPGIGRYRNGYRMGWLKTAEGAVPYAMPQMRPRDSSGRVRHPKSASANQSLSTQRPDWLAEDAVRSETVSGTDLPAICDLQGDFRKLQGEPILRLSNFIMLSICCKEYSRREEQGEFLDIAGKSSVELRMAAGWARGKSRG
jgi:hypothetical protein